MHQRIKQAYLGHIGILGERLIGTELNAKLSNKVASEIVTSHNAHMSSIDRNLGADDQIRHGIKFIRVVAIGKLLLATMSL